MKYPHEIIASKGVKKLSMLTAYDYSMSSILNITNIDMILVGDSLGNVVMGLKDTIGVTVDDMIHHAKAVRLGAPEKFIVVDLPFMVNLFSTDEALKICAKIMQVTSVDAIKIEGGEHNLELFNKLNLAGIPVMGHLGLTPQSYLSLGGYKVQGKDEKTKEKILKDASLISRAGVFAIVLECVPEVLAKEITELINIPTIGIGSGKHTDGQVLVINDLLGLTCEKTPSFVKSKVDLKNVIYEAVSSYITEIGN